MSRSGVEKPYCLNITDNLSQLLMGNSVVGGPSGKAKQFPTLIIYIPFKRTAIQTLVQMSIKKLHFLHTR
jgi:hypothetical protein